MKRPSSSIQPVPGMLPGCTNHSQSARAVAAAAVEPRAAVARDHQEAAAGDVRDLGGAVLRAGVGDDDLAQNAIEGAGDQRRQRVRQQAL